MRFGGTSFGLALSGQRSGGKASVQLEQFRAVDTVPGKPKTALTGPWRPPSAA